VPAESYRAVMESICQFLEGKYSPILLDMRQKMEAAAEALKFEEASLWRDRLAALERLMENQLAVSSQDSDRDVIGIARNGTETCIQKLEIRDGRMVSSAAFFFPEEQDDDPELLAAFLLQYYPNAA